MTGLTEGEAGALTQPDSQPMPGGTGATFVVEDLGRCPNEPVSSLSG